MEAQREIGTVKVWKENGFGWIKRDSNGRDIFVHYSAITDTEDVDGRKDLFVGDKVSFEVGPGSRDSSREQAFAVTVLA